MIKRISKFDINQETFRRLFGIFMLLCIMAITGHIALASEIDVIKKRVMDELLSSGVDNNEIEDLLNTQREDGTWPGINYEDVSRTGFEHRIHTANMVTLSKAYQAKGGRYRNNRKVRQAIQKALAHWVEKDYFCENWWHNQIGTPTNLVAVMLLAGSDMPKELVEKAQPMIGRAHLEASGARPSGDRIKIAGILAKNLLFREDKQQFDEVIKVIEGEIKFSSGERGMQHDYSFHHRHDRVNNTLSYGLGYADAFVEWAVYVAGTDYAFSDEKIKQLVDYYLDGICKTMVFGKYPDPGAKNRSVARKGALNPMDAHTPKKLMQATDYRKEELEEIIKFREGELDEVSLSHSTFFWHSEHFTFQRPHYYASVRMYSTRNRNMEEPYNSEGLKNHHRGDGANHVLLTGEEYYDIYPVMDYQKVPGATILQKEALPDENQIQRPGLTDFVGAATDGLYGVASFDFKSPHDPVQARKSWFFFDEEYVCLGAGIQAGTNRPVVTTVNQNLVFGDVVVGNGKEQKASPKGEHELDHVEWVYSDRMAYVFPEPQKVHLFHGPVTGNWTDISKQTSAPKEDVTMDIFKLWVDHGSRPSEGSYAYIVLPGVNREQAASYDHASRLQILANTKDVQAVKHKGLGIYQLVFYQSAELDLGEGMKVIMDGPGQVILQMDGKAIKKITVADPARKLGKMHFRINVPVNHTEAGFAGAWNPQNEYSEIAVDLPRDVYAGKSVTVDL
ncbi:polysaccharide lyase family 8 super-sandwich domain-containing protein [Negadavirga shengliensis]|uniref:Polysaccharide lyase family 8 super-sandwich domain-containing protein n=1 Tax=Negadavirga shengliensis TaxID=1389218 RepID=A0ABV9SXG0_9BACT